MRRERSMRLTHAVRCQSPRACDRHARQRASSRADRRRAVRRRVRGAAAPLRSAPQLRRRPRRIRSRDARAAHGPVARLRRRPSGPSSRASAASISCSTAGSSSSATARSSTSSWEQQVKDLTATSLCAARGYAMLRLTAAADHVPRRRRCLRPQGTASVDAVHRTTRYAVLRLHAVRACHELRGIRLDQRRPVREFSLQYGISVHESAAQRTAYTRRSRPTLSYTSARVRPATSEARSALAASTRSSSALSSSSSRARERTGPNSPTTTSARPFLKSP